MDSDRLRKVVQPDRDCNQWKAHFIASYNPNLSAKYAEFFFEGGAFVGPNGIVLKKLYGNDMESTPFLSALMQLSAIQAVVGSAGGRDVVSGYNIWDCFFGHPQYLESMDSMWRYLFKVLKLGGVGRIDFTILFDITLPEEDMVRQRRYVAFCKAFFKKLGLGCRQTTTIVDNKLKKELWQKNLNLQ